MTCPWTEEEQIMNKMINSLILLLLVVLTASPARPDVGIDRTPPDGQEERDVVLLGLNIGLSSFNLYHIIEDGSVVWGLIGFGVGVTSLALATVEDPGTKHQRSLQVAATAGLAVGSFGVLRAVQKRRGYDSAHSGGKPRPAVWLRGWNEAAVGVKLDF